MESLESIFYINLGTQNSWRCNCWRNERRKRPMRTTRFRIGKSY